MARSFSEDGAAGASSSSGVSPGMAVPNPPQMSDPGGGPPQNVGDPNPPNMPSVGGANSYAAPGSAPKVASRAVSPGLGSFGSGLNSADPNGRYFSGGGAIEEPGQGDRLQQAINAALETVDNGLSYGRKLHGLGGGDDEAIPGQQAQARMPMAPGSQSETGPRTQPAPGALPPASNPFGRRADAGDSAIPDTDDEQEG